jgi:tetratricopeptide (TPR) repeat protein
MTRALAANGVDPAPNRLGAGSSARLRMTGTVDRDGDRYVINAQVGDRKSGAVLWSRRFDRPVGDAAGFQETTASHLSAVLQCGQTRANAYRGRMPDRLLGMFLNACSAARDESDPAGYLEATRRIVDAAPRLSTAHSMHAAAALSARGSQQTPEYTASLREEARASANRALALDPRNGEAFAVLAFSGGAADLRANEIYLRRALELGWAPANDYYIWFLLKVGRVHEAADLAARTAATDPFSVTALERLAWLQAVTGDPLASRQALGRLELLDPGVGLDARLRIAFWHEDPPRALAEYRQAEGRWRTGDIVCAQAFLGGGWLTGAGRQGLPAACEDHQPSWKIRMLARSGQIEAAYRATSADFAELSKNTIFVFYPEMKRFRQDARFMPLARRLGLVDYWLQTGRWPDFCNEPDLPYDCRAAAQAAQKDNS